MTIRRAILVAAAAAVAGSVAWDRVEAHRLSAEIAAIAAKGEPVDLSFRDAPLPTPQHQEAAQLYAEAAAAAAEMLDRDHRLATADFDGVSGVPVVPADFDQTFRLDCPALQLLDRATTLPFAGMGEYAPDHYYDNESSLQGLSALSALRADILSLRGDADGAVDGIVASLGVQRTLPALFYRFIAAGRLFGSLRILLRHTTPSGAALTKLQKAFDDLSDDDGLAQSVRERRAAFIAALDDPPPDPIARTLVFLLHPYLTRLTRAQLEQFDTVAAVVEQPWPDKIQSIEAMLPDFSRTPAGRGAFAYLPRYRFRNIAVFAADYRSAGRTLAVRRVAIVTLAIERYRRSHGGDPPPTLAALVPAYLTGVPVDPFSGRNLVYRREEDAYLVYSVDANRKDDGGALYGFGSQAPVAAAMTPTRDFGIRVPLAVKAAAR